MTQVGRYQIQEELGRGAMGVSFKALDTAIGRTVAVKAIPLPDLAEPAERQLMRDRLRRETQSAAVLSHPNIIAVYDVLEQQDLAYVFMEYVPGASLDSMLRTGSLPAGSALLEYLRQAAQALDYADRKGILHGAIKPANILIADVAAGAERLAKVADFGVAKIVSQAATQNGSMTGTPNYMSPEQIQGTTLDGRSDQFSLGVIVYELLTGAKPFTGDDVSALFYSICKQDPQPAERLNPTLSESVGKVLGRALSKEANERFASCGDFIGALSIALGESSEWSAGTVPAAEAPLQAPVEAPPTTAVARTGPIITIPENSPYDLPTRPRRRRDEDEEELGEPSRSSSIRNKLAVILAMCCAIAATIVFIVRSNSGPAVPTQILDSKLGPLSPPPEGMEVTSPGPAPGRANTASATRKAQVPKNRTEQPISPSRAEILQTGAPAPVPSQLANGGEVSDVELLTEPPGARILVDGRSDLACNAPCAVSLRSGRHTLSAELSGYNIARRIFNVPDQKSLILNLSPSMGVLMVSSFPRACTVVVDGRPSGQTPLTLHLGAGSHRVGVEGPASQHEENVEVQTDGFDAKRFPCQ